MAARREVVGFPLLRAWRVSGYVRSRGRQPVTQPALSGSVFRQLIEQNLNTF
jgi:hypothetical protein